ncbi:hypothetical protein JNZ24_10765 [Streptococcus suis]|nr:hypothetical protein [Streptococcus suis]
MTPHREGFSTYVAGVRGTVYMGNHNPCTIVSIGDVRISMFDGTVRTVSAVRHVSDLGKSLLSIDKFDEDGYAFSSKDGMMKISKGVMVVLKAK